MVVFFTTMGRSSGVIGEVEQIVRLIYERVGKTGFIICCTLENVSADTNSSKTFI